MSNVIKIEQFKKQQLKQRNKANTLCRSGFHKWQIIHKDLFDVKKGKLITTLQCKFCKKLKTTSA